MGPDVTTRRFAYVAVTSLLVGAQLGVALVNVAMALLVVAWASSWRPQRAPRALWLPVAVLAGLTVAHTVVRTEAQSPETYAGSLRVLLVLLLVGSLSTPWSAAGRQRVLVVALAVAAVSMGYALVQVLAQTPGPLRALHPDALQWSSRNYRGSGDWLTFSINGLRGTGLVHHVLSFAHVSCVLALTGWAHALFARRHRALWGSLALAATFGMVLSGARAALVGFAFGVAVLALFRWVSSSRLRGAGLVMMLAAVGGGFGALVSTPDLRERIGSFSGRVPIWAHAREAAAASFPRGMGYGTYPAYAERTYGSVPALAGKVRGWAHNFWLSVWAEAPLALIGWVWLFVALARRAIRQAAANADQGLGAALCATLGAWLVISLFHDSHFQREYFPLVLCLWGLFLSPTWRMEVSDDGSVAS